MQVSKGGIDSMYKLIKIVQGIKHEIGVYKNAESGAAGIEMDIKLTGGAEQYILVRQKEDKYVD